MAGSAEQDAESPADREIVTFEVEGPQTRFGFSRRFGTVAGCEVGKRFAQEGNGQTCLRLAALLAEG
jgi:hypothetical protein